MSVSGSSSAVKRGATRSRKKNRPSPRERLLGAATALFTTEGIRVIGIDRVLREADVAKASLYSLFGSKDALVAAYLERLHEQWCEQWQERADATADIDAKVLTFFDKEIDEQPARAFRGSHFQNAVSEYPLPDTPSEVAIVSAVQEHRRWMFETLSGLLEQKYGYPGDAMARKLFVLYDGGLAGVKLTRDLTPLRTARELAVQLLGTPPADYSI